MSIIIPGQSKKPHIYEAARKLAEKDWDPFEYLETQYELFLSAIERNSSKDYKYKSEYEYTLAGMPKWSESDTFGEWMKDVADMIEFRLVELKQRKEDTSKSIPHLIGLIREAQEEGAADMAVEGLGEQMQIEDYEVFEMILRKSYETVQDFLHDKINLKDNLLSKQEVEVLLEQALRQKKILLKSGGNYA